MPSTQLRRLLREGEVEGRLEVNPAGFGFVVPDLSSVHTGELTGVDIYIAAANLTWRAVES